jgi:dTDP-3-amino-3,4,6-trideoxy-alpha-D-glucose transaminase
VFHTYTIRVPGGRRDALRRSLGARGIGTQIHYPVPAHLQNAASFLGYRRGDLPVTERICDEVLSLPMYAEISEEQQEHVAAAVSEFMKGH